MLFLKRLYLFFIAIAFAIVFLIPTKAFSNNEEIDIGEDYVLYALNKLPRFYHQDMDEPTEDRIYRLKLLSNAISRAAKIHKPAGVDVIRMEAALSNLAFKETALARNVASGNCLKMPKGMQCDLKDGKPRAKTYFQLWKKTCPEIHNNKDLIPGSQEQLNIAAECAAKHLTYSYNRCKSVNPAGAWAGAYSGYRSICVWEPAEDRVKYMMYVDGLMRNYKYKIEKSKEL